MMKNKLQPGDKVRITSDPKLLEKNGLEVFLEDPDLYFGKEFTIKYFSFRYYNLLEDEVNSYDFHPELLIKA